MTKKPPRANPANLAHRSPHPDDPAAFTGRNRHTDGSKPDTHPSWGTVHFGRATVSGGGMRLFGSALPSNTVMTLTVRRATRQFDLHTDWIHGGDELIEVMLSPVQFAELLTTMNAGSGTPCTIRFVAPGGEGRIPEAPDEPTLRERVINDFKDDVKSWADKLRQMERTIHTVLEKPVVNKGDREVIKHELQQMIQHVSMNTTFTAEQFERATDKATMAAKAEVEAFVTSAVQRLGFQKLDELKTALGAGEAPASPAALPGPDPVDSRCPYPSCNVRNVRDDYYRGPNFGPGWETNCGSCGHPLIVEGDGTALWYAVDGDRLMLTDLELFAQLRGRGYFVVAGVDDGPPNAPTPTPTPAPALGEGCSSCGGSTGQQGHGRDGNTPPRNTRPCGDCDGTGWKVPPPGY